MQQISHTGNLGRVGDIMFFVIKEANEAILDFSHETIRVL